MKKWISSALISAVATLMGNSICQAQPSNLENILSLSTQIRTHRYSPALLTYDKITLNSFCTMPKPVNYGYLSELQLECAPLDLYSPISRNENTKNGNTFDFEPKEIKQKPSLNFYSHIKFPKYREVADGNKFDINQILFDINRSQKAKYNKIKKKRNQFWSIDPKNVYVDMIRYTYGFENTGLAQEEQINQKTSDAFDPQIYAQVGKEIIARLADEGNKSAIWLYQTIKQIEKTGKLFKNLQKAVQDIYIIDLTHPLEDISNPLSGLEEFIDVPNKYKKKKFDITATIEPAINEDRIGSGTFSDIYQSLTGGKAIRPGVLVYIEIAF